MYRLFSTFPDGWPGVGCLLLRVSLCLSVLAEGLTYLHTRFPVTLNDWVVGGSSCILGTALLLGIVTPVASIFSGAGTAGIALLSVGSPTGLREELATAQLLLWAAALALVGPGAYSLDARLFGRRAIIIPKKL